MNLKYDTKFKTLGSQAAHLVTTLYEENHSFFRLKDIQRILSLSDSASRNFVRKLVNRGIASRLKPGLFILVPFELGKEREYMGDSLVVARKLAEDRDYYLSHNTAMEIHGMVTQPQLVIHITTTEKRRSITIMGTEFRFTTCKREMFFGLTDYWVSKQEKVVISDLERTIIDCLKQPEYCGGITEVAKGIWMRSRDIHVSKLTEYAVRLKVGAVIRRLGYILELYGIGSQEDQKALLAHLTDTYVKLDPILPAGGKFTKKWRLQQNVTPEELLSIVKT